MNKIIVLPGTADAIFFINEVDYLTKNFDEVIIISYLGDEEKFSRISNEKGFTYYVVKTRIFKTIINMDFYKWLLSKSVIKEIKDVFSLSKQGLFRLLYILHYGLFYVEAKKYIDKVLLKNNKDRIYLYSFWLTRAAYTIAHYSINRENSVKRILSRAHGYDIYEERNPMNYLPFRNYINSNLDEIHFISNDGLNYFSNKYVSEGLCSKKYISRLGTFNPNILRKKIYDKNKICIASCSSIIPIKRLDLIIDVIANIDIPVEWIHIGVGIQKSEMESYAANKLKGKVFHFLGQINNSEILKTYVEYDVDFFINMSDSEGIPVSIMEAMSLGIPTIARNVGGINEIVNTNTGCLIGRIDNLDYVYRQVNVTTKQRFYEVDKYISKSGESLNIWKLKFDANNNYEEFFRCIKEIQ